ncbi:huntingtin-interacting protein 1 isoform X2 [Anthonomus grandis grandis]|uniref:huntingtin-interacting protein 1 isoform X2 n=1 Tax=Anthonomus grandis grandis TaxID=2921223 RepID=UPI002166B42C|nr:huntingtin-interacting protein 1 isoform X2 [Anthonomus grandis grandis]
MAKIYTERDYEKYSQALQKAINGQECPVKQKHVRSAIIGTFQTQSAKIFWAYALRLPAMEDQIVAWKLCHVVHKVLREGHPLCLVDSQRHRKELDEIGKLWGHLEGGYGKMIRLYTALLINKLEFHKRNPRFPGHMGVTYKELESIGGNEDDIFFDLVIEMFDYVDHVLALQDAVFGSLNMARSNSMTSAGQCRLAPLIPCIQDASKLYDYCVKILFRLYMRQPYDVLAGHRERFVKQFRALKKFYENTSNLQYFKDLISISPLPENPPDFEWGFRNYVTQEVVVPQEPEHEEEPPPPIQEENLIDTTDHHVEAVNDHVEQHTIQVSVAAHQEIIQEREFLRGQCEKLRDEINSLMSKNQRDIATMQLKISHLEHDLATKDSELEHEKQVKEDLLTQSFAVAQNQDSEQKQFHEKFDKLKSIYVKLRDEHVTEIRKKAEIEKKLSTALKALERLHELEMEKEKLEVAERQKSEELSALQKDKELFNMETEILKKSATDACQQKDSLQQEIQRILREKDLLRQKSEELSYKLTELEGQIDNERKEVQLNLQSLVKKCIENGEDVLRHVIQEVDNPATSGLTCNPDYLRGLTEDCKNCLEDTLSLIYTDYGTIITTTNKIAHRHALFILQGRATSNTSPDIHFGEKMVETCKVLGEIVLRLLEHIKKNQSTESVVREALDKLEEITRLGDDISKSLLGEKAENLDEMLEDEMSLMDKAIEEAANKIQEMLTNSRAADSGIKLEVNEKILDTCTKLMQAIRLLVKKSRLLQAEIVAQGRGTASAKDFYKRNHQWTDGFISAAKAVGAAAQFLLTAADKVVVSNGKLEQLVVAAQEIAASTAQLVVACRVKADRTSENLQQLKVASRGVTGATGEVVATVKDCGQLMEENEELDVSNLSLHQAKRLEMESQVRVLELEKELEQERYRLAKLRKHHYQLAGET